VVLSNDFEDGSWAPWTASGSPGLSVVDDGDGGSALLVGDRTAGSAGVRFVVKPDYTWVGNTTMTADAWATVTGSFTAPAAADPAALQVYVGTGDLDAPYSYLLDDIVVSTLPGDAGWEPTPDPTFVPGGATAPVETPVTSARGSGDVAALTFDDGPNPGETDDLLDLLAETDVHATFCVIGQNVTAPGGAELLRRIVADGHTLCNHSTSYADMGSWTQTQVETDLKANLAIIRDALGDPDQPVPYFRAPNGSWGATPEVAVALGMQPLGLGNVILDWDGNDLSEATLTENLRAAVTPGAIVLVHDGGGVRDAGIAAVRTVLTERLDDGWVFTLPTGGVAASATVLSSDFEDGLDGWGPRADAQGPPTVALTTAQAHGGAQSAAVTERSSQGDGLARDVTGLLAPGTTYQVSAWVRFAGGGPGDVWLSMQRTVDGADTFDTLAQLTGVTSGSWHRVAATVTMSEADAATLYLETDYPDGTTADLLVDDVLVTAQGDPVVQDLTPLKDTIDVPVGFAIDSRETTGGAAELLVRHTDQVTGENHMKPEAWYDDARTFRTHPEATTLMGFAQENDLRVYGHTLVWHSQTPEWFFQHEDGTPLAAVEADQELLRERMRTHIFSVAEALSTGGGYGLFGSETNPVVAFDVVNEVVSDGRTEADGLRRSEWYRVLGEEYLDLAFRYADEALNDTFAVPGDSRPVTLTINDYNTEQSGKQQRLHALVERLVARGVPVDAVGHQFHVSLAMPVQALEDAIVAFADLPVTQVVSELDVTTGTPVTSASLVEQRYYYRDVFRVFREHADDLFSVTVWGLTDGRSWRASSGAPLLFDDDLQAKPAYHGAVDGDLEPRQRAALVFRGDVPVAAGATSDVTWSRLPLHPVEDLAGFSLRWEPDHLTAYVRVADATLDATDAVELVLGDETTTVTRSGDGDADAVVEPVDGGWAAVVRLPLDALTPAAEGDRLALDVRVTDGDSTVAWNVAGATGSLTLVEALSTTDVVEATTAPEVDGVVDDVWAGANAVTTDKQVQGEGGASATVRTLWRGSTLYVLAEVADPELDATGSDPWVQDSVEIFLDAGNAKNGPYRAEDAQVRISHLNAVSFGTGDEAAQEARLVSGTTVVDGGYVVEASLDLLETGGPGTFHGLDVQVNDASGGTRTTVRSWADPTGLGYQSTARWGVAQLVAAPFVPDPAVSTGSRSVRAGDVLAVEVEGFVPGSTVALALERGRGRHTSTVALGDVVVGADGTVAADVRIPRRTHVGAAVLVARSGELTAKAPVRVLPARGNGGCWRPS
jgi:endo-1,4-beta-xylanase